MGAAVIGGGASLLLSRYAEALFWLARYMERAENLARILDVQETFSRDVPAPQSWMSIVQLNADEERFLEKYRDAGPASVIDFYLLDGSNPSSILSSIRNARANARTLRPLISTEMWTQLNVFYNHLRATEASRIQPSELPRLCALIKEGCQTHMGITEGTFYRDQGWYFYQLGRSIERADQTTRILDIKYHHLLPRLEDVGTLLDLNQWHGLLRSVSGYHAYRRLHPSGMSIDSVVGFLLLNRRFSRSLALCVAQLGEYLDTLRTRYGLPGGAGAAARVDALRNRLERLEVDVVLKAGLHEFLDTIQAELSVVSNDVASAYFARERTMEDAAT